jgi:hypothetical protein
MPSGHEGRIRAAQTSYRDAVLSHRGNGIYAEMWWSEGGFSAAVGNTVQGGWDTDSNGATVGAVMGALLGAQALPEHFIVPLEDRTRSAVFGYDHSRISDLANRTLAISQRLNRVLPPRSSVGCLFSK